MGNAQEIPAVPHRQVLLDGIDQHDPPDGSVCFGEGAARQGRNVCGREQAKIRGDVDLGDLLAIFFAQRC